MEILAQQKQYAPAMGMDPHTDGCRRLSILVGGELAETGDHATEHASVGSVALKAPEFVHHNHFGPAGTTIVSVVLSDAILRQLGAQPHRLSAWQWHHAGEPSIRALRLAVALRLRRSGAAAAALQGLVRDFESDSLSARPEVRPRHVQEVAGLVNAFHTAPSVHSLAQLQGVHPVALGRRFRRHFGCSITRYRQRARTLAVARALLGSRSSLVEIAMEHEFSDLSHMTRLFRREFDVPPGVFRDTLQGSDHQPRELTEEWRLTA